jgi:Raf kinase inhibitor-like YbhB/YbcL family protein
MKLTSPAFKEGATIPDEYTCDGDNVSPALRWETVPAGTKSLALTCDDPDAPGGTWVHWLLYDIPPNLDRLPQNVPPVQQLPSGARQGTNSFQEIGYGGPCPPRGKGPHRYYFKLYALDKTLDLPPGANIEQVEEAMKGHILGKGELMGRFGH